MRNKNKENSKVPKSAKTRLSDLTPQKQARGGKIPGGIAVGRGTAPTPPAQSPPATSAVGRPPLNR